MEEDAGKSLHEGFADADHKTAIDLNRTGVPLAEIVSEPDMRSPEEAYEYLTRLKKSFSTPASATATWKRARCAATPTSACGLADRKNSEPRPKSRTSTHSASSSRRWSTRSSGRSRVIEGGGRITQETRLYNAHEGRTYGMRSKEQAHDYRYFPEPDCFRWWWMKNGRPRSARRLPELAGSAAPAHDQGIRHHRRRRLHADADAERWPMQFESAARAAKNPKRVANLVQSELMGVCKAQGLELEQSPISMAGARLGGSGGVGRDLRQDAEGSLRPVLRARQGFPAVYEAEGRPSSRATPPPSRSLPTS